MIYAAANLKRYFTAFGLPLPTDVQAFERCCRLWLRFGAATGAGAARGDNPPTCRPRPRRFIGREAQLSAG